MIIKDDKEIKSFIDKNINIQNNYLLEKVILEQKEKYDDDIYYFDENEALKLYKFLSKLTLDKGKKGQKVKLLKFQFEILTSILCVKNRETGFRRFKEAHLNIGRKNGKGSLVAWIIIYLYFTDSTYGAEYIIVANDIKQATNLFNTIKLTITNNVTLKKYVKITDSKKQMYRKSTNSYLRVLSNEGGNLDSYASYIVVLDEVHEYKNDEAYSKLITGMGLWDEPIMFTTTTASSGEDEYNLEYQMYSYSKKIENKEVDDKTFYFSIYEAENNCDIFDIEQWCKANPALGCFKKVDDFIKLAKKASAMKTFEAKFRRLYLNQHIATDNIKNAINMDLWNKCTRKITLDELKNYKLCWCGLDLSSKNDITAFVQVFYDEDIEKYIIYPHLFTPKSTIFEREEIDKNPYSKWVKEGFLIALEGKYINFELLLDYLYALNDDFEFEKIGFDRWGSPTIINRLESKWDILGLGQGFQTFTPFINDFENMLIDEKLIIAENEVFNFMAKNTIAVYDDAMNIKYSKKKSSFKIDGIIAMVMALGIAIEENEVGHYNPFAELEKIEGWSN